MSKENTETVKVYKQIAHIYLSNSKEHDNNDLVKARKKKDKLREFISKSCQIVGKANCKVFEIGSGDGSNAALFKELGHDVVASDTADAFIAECKEKGLNTIKFNALENNFPDKYDIVFAWRVFVHFTKADLFFLMRKAYRTLNDGGIFVFNVRNRESTDVDCEWLDFTGEYHMGAERFYNYFTQEEIETMTKDAGFTIEHFHKEGGDKKNKWLVYCLKKQ